MDKYIGIDLGGSKIRFNDVDGNGNDGKEHQVFIPKGINNQDIGQLILRGLERVVENIQKNGDNVIAIGLGSPGPLDYRRGIIETPPNLSGINNLPIVKIICEVYDTPAYLVHDADAHLLGEQWKGAACGFQNIAMVTLGTGVGFSVKSDDHLVRGRGRASEAGHTDLGMPHSRLCSCGRSNHWEAFVSTNGLARTYCIFFGINYNDLTEEGRYKVSFELREWLYGSRRNHRWRLLLDEYCKHMVLGLRNILCNFDPECIVLGGGIMVGNHQLLDEIKLAWQKFMFGEVKDSMATMATNLKIVLAKLPNAGVIGAAKYAMDCYAAEVRAHKAEHGVIS